MVRGANWGAAVAREGLSGREGAFLAHQLRLEVLAGLRELSGLSRGAAIDAAIEGEIVSKSDSLFIDYAGVSWRRLSDGSVEPSPYCPYCHKPLVVRLSYQHLVCATCGMSSKFKRSELAGLQKAVVAEKRA